jgi:hypothetical protein
MPTALDAPTDKLDDHERHFVAKVRQHGWFATDVFADGEGPGFTYTTGFWHGRKVPEIIVFSLPPDIAHDVLWDVYRGVSTGMAFPAEQRLSTIFANVEGVLLPVSRQFYPDFLGWSRWFYGGDDWPCLQLLWPDPNGIFPWQAEHEERYANRQPNLTGEAWRPF